MKKMFQNAKAKISNYVMCKAAGVECGDHLVEVLGTIIIAVVILIFFRSQIVNMFNSMMNETNTKVNQLFNDVAGA